MILIIFKGMDIVMKLMLLRKIENNEPLGMFAYMIKHDMGVSNFMKVGVSLFYVMLFYVAFNPQA
jgi:hypothetical protein